MIDFEAENLIADAYQLIDWWLTARDENIENHDLLARKWIEHMDAWLAASVAVGPENKGHKQ